MRLIDAENFSKAMKDYFTDMITHHKYKDLKITLEDFECKCPYCRKKIKVVE